MTIDEIPGATANPKIPLVFEIVPPSPHSAFSTYSVLVGPPIGLVKIVAMSARIPTSRDGREVRYAFSELQEALRKNYGTPSEALDRVKVGSDWTSDSDFLISLALNERVLSSTWMLNDHPDKITRIELEANAIPADVSEGTLKFTLITLVYEFVGVQSVLDTYKAERDKHL